MVAQNSLGDARIAQLVQTCLSMVAPHVDYQHCCEAARAGLEYGKLVSFPYPKCGTVCYDPVERAMKLQAQHGCVVYKHKWSKYLLVQGNPIAALGCQLRDSTLYMHKLPVDRSTLGVTDHYVGCCQSVRTCGEQE